jgi:5,10-methylenetetrahydromethanopterin reductase
MSMGFNLHGSVRSLAEGVARACRSEELGYEGIYLADSQMNTPDPFQVFAVAAGETQKIRLGTAVTNMVYRDPTILACSAATLNEVSDGRAVLGMGTGDGPIYGLGRKATRMAAFEEGLRVIRELVHGRAIPLPTGKKVPLRHGKFPVSLYLSVEGPRGLRLAGRLADGVILGNGFDLNVLQWARDRIAEGAAEAGRSLDAIDIMAAGMIYVSDDGDEARDRVRCRLANRAHHNFRFTMETVPSGELPGIQKFMDAFDITKPIEERVPAKLVTEYLLQRFSIAGTPAECIERVRSLENAGVKRLMVTPPGGGYDDLMERWAKEVMPPFGKGGQ